MPQINEIKDGGPSPNTPTIGELRASQKAGATGTGTDQSYADKMKVRNHGVGVGQEGSDETFPVAADYKEAGNTGLPWD